MNKEKPIYEISLSEANEVYAISLVEKPANQTEFMLFSETDVETVKLNSFQDRQIVTGVVLIPNQIINRKSPKTGEVHQIYFNEGAIEDLSIKFFENGFQTNANFQHNENDEIQDLVYFESWLVQDPINDKSNALGFSNLPKGTWMASAKIKDETTWNRIKSGEVKGFSIEGFLNKQLKLSLDESPKLINNNKLDKKEMNLLKELSNVLVKLTATEEVKMESVYVVGQQLENKGAEYSFEEDGYTITVDAEGIVTDVSETVPTAEQVEVVDAVEMTVEADVAAEIISADTEQIDAEVEKPVEVVDIEALKKLVEDLKAQIDVLETEKAKMTLSIEKLSAEPVATKLSANEVSNKKETRLEILSRIVNQ